jgi:hypothetical protein
MYSIQQIGKKFKTEDLREQAVLHQYRVYIADLREQAVFHQYRNNLSIILGGLIRLIIARRVNYLVMGWIFGTISQSNGFDNKIQNLVYA